MIAEFWQDDAGYFQWLKQHPRGYVLNYDGLDGTRRRIAVAEKYWAEFAVATECGFGRRDPETIVPLLRIHAEVADLRT